MAKSTKLTDDQEKVILIAVSLNSNINDDNLDNTLSELESLAHTANLEVVGKVYQNIKQINAVTFIGSGKVEEIAMLVNGLNAGAVIFDCELSGSQIKNISDIAGCKVIDRSMLILDIFAGRATSNEGRLQVQLAQLKYTLPRISAISGTSGRFGAGGVGMRGPGETKLELDKRIVKDNILKLEKQIEKLKEQRYLRQQNRIKNKIKSVAIIGYTNAGKSTLMNVITKAGIYADDKLFATLDTTTRSVWFDSGKEIILTDTVGFIDKLPHAFIEAFAATLEEAANADLLVHVVDVTNPDYKNHIRVVEEVLTSLNANKIPMLTVYNKIDKNDRPFEIPKDVICISAKNNLGIDKLKDKIVEKLF